MRSVGSSPGCWGLACYLDTMSFGDATANTMGAPVTWDRVIALMAVARLAAATVQVVDAIGFVGLIVPPAARLVPASALLGAVRQLSFSEQVGLEGTSMQVREIVEMDQLAGRGCLFSQPDGQDRRLLEQAMADADMTGVTQRRYPTLSDGEKQRTHVARALAQDAGTIILDEPKNHLALHHQHQLLRDLAPGGVLLALHDLGLAAHYRDELIVLHRGEMAATGSPVQGL